MATVEEKARQIVCEQLGVEESEVTAAAKFQDDFGADSLDVVELTMAFEEAFDIEIPDEVVDKVETFADVLKYLNSVKLSKN